MKNGVRTILPKTKKLRVVSKAKKENAKIELARRRLKLYFFRWRLETMVRFLTEDLLKLAFIKQVT